MFEICASPRSVPSFESAFGFHSLSSSMIAKSVVVEMSYSSAIEIACSCSEGVVNVTSGASGVGLSGAVSAVAPNMILTRTSKIGF